MPLIGHLWKVISTSERALEWGLVCLFSFSFVLFWTDLVGVMTFGSFRNSQSHRMKYGYAFSSTIPGLRLIDISRPDWLEYIQKSKLVSFLQNMCWIHRSVLPTHCVFFPQLTLATTSKVRRDYLEWFA